jgi:hypothetical protein
VSAPGGGFVVEAGAVGEEGFGHSAGRLIYGARTAGAGSFGFEVLLYVFGGFEVFLAAEGCFCFCFLAAGGLT